MKVKELRSEERRKFRVSYIECLGDDPETSDSQVIHN